MPAHASEELRQLVLRKVQRLEKFYDRIVAADVYLKASNHANDEATAEIRLNVPADTLFCAESGASFEEAIDKASDNMERQLKRFKERLAQTR